MQSSNAPHKKMTSSSFSEYVLNMADLYNLAMRNGYYLPSQKSSAVNELMLYGCSRVSGGARNTRTSS